MPPLIQTRDLTRTYMMGGTEVIALDGVTIDIEAGEFVALLGTSGSGKSTLLNLLGALDRPTSGEILFEGRPLAPLSSRQLARYRREAVGMIFQNFNLVATTSAAENVALALAFNSVRGRERVRRTQALLERVGLGARLNHRPAELSGGEQQRVAIARALANNPRVLLADEPTGNLDSTRAHELLTLLRRMVAADNLTIVMVTHDRELAATFADRTIEMKDGRVLD